MSVRLLSIDPLGNVRVVAAASDTVIGEEITVATGAMQIASGKLQTERRQVYVFKADTAAWVDALTLKTSC
jgi:hypothetical protein